MFHPPYVADMSRVPRLSRNLSIGILLLGIQVFGFGQTLTLTIGSGSGTAGATVSLPITLTSSGGAQASGLQWSFVYPSDITSFTVVAGPSATNAAKSITCSANSCLVLGFNNTVMTDGTVATAIFHIAANASTTTIPVQISGVVASTGSGDSIPASGGSGTITLSTPQVSLSGLSCTPTTINSAGSALCTVSLSAAAPSGGLAVALTSGNPNVTVPTSVNVSTGQTGASFSASATSVATNQTALLTAALNGGSKQVTLTIHIPPQLTSISCSPSILGSNASSLCTVSLSGAAPGSTTVSLSSNSSALTVPSSVNIPSGQSSTVFSATTGTVGVTQTATITGSVDGVNRSAAVGLTTDLQVSELSCSPSTFTDAGSTNCAVSLTGPAPVDGTTVTLSSNSTLVTVPGIVNVGASQNSASFTAIVASATTTQAVLLTATLNGGSQHLTLTLNPPGLVQPSGLTCSPASVVGPGVSLCTVTLSGAPSTGATVTLSTSDGHVTVPATVTVGQGQLTASFSATATAVSSDIQVQITASLNSGSQQFSLAVNAPVQTVEISSLNCLPATLSSTKIAQCSVSLQGPAGSNLGISLNSDQSNLLVPPLVTIPAGSSVGTFLAAAQTVTSSGTGTIKASLNSVSRTTAISLVPQNSFKSLTCAPSVLQNNSSAVCNLQITQPADGPIQVNLSSSDAALTLPATTTIPVHQTSVSFQIQAGTVAKPKAMSVLATATVGSVTGSVQILQGQPPVLTVPDRITTAVDSLISFTATATDAGFPVVISASALPPGAVFHAGTFTWTPNRELAGSYTITITATNSVTGLSSSAFVVIDVEPAKAQLTGLFNSASLAPGDVCSSGSIGTLTGSGFTDQPPQVASGSVWPTELAGVQVNVNGEPVPLLYSSNTLINFQCPNLPAGAQMSITVKPASLAAPGAFTITMGEASPGIFLIDGVHGAVLISGTNEIAMPATSTVPSRPARIGEYISIYANGLGPLTEPLEAGMPAPLDHVIQATDTVLVVVGDAELELTPSFVGLAPGFVGLYLANVQLPVNVQTGSSVPIYLKVISSDQTVLKSNVAQIAIEDSNPQ